MIVTASDPAVLASLTLAQNNTSATVTVQPVMSTNTFTFNPPLSLAPGATLTFTVTADTAGSLARLDHRIAYAAVLVSGRFDRLPPLMPLGGGLAVVGLMLVPLENRKRRRTAMLALLALALVAGLAGCTGGGSSNSRTAADRSPVDGSGTLSKPVSVSSITVTSGTNSATSMQQVVAVKYE